MQLSKKVEAFSEYFTQFLESASNSKHFEKKLSLVAYVFSKLQTVKDMVRQMSKYPRLLAAFSGQDVKGSLRLVKSPCGYFYQILLDV